MAWSRVSAAMLLILAALLEIFGPDAWARLDGLGATVNHALPWMLHLAALAMIAAAAALVARRAALGAGLALTAWLLMVGAARTCEAGLGAPRALVERLRAERRAEEPIVEYRSFNAGLPFYLRQTIPMLEVPRELDFDAPAAEKAMLTREEARDLIHAHSRLWVYAPSGTAAPLATELGGRYSPWASWHGREVARIDPIE